MKIEIKFTGEEARVTQWFLRRRYENKAWLPRLAKAAIREAVKRQAVREFGNCLKEEEVEERIKALL